MTFLPYLTKINRFSTIAIFITAFLSPCCFPLFAFVATALGIGSGELFGGWSLYIIQVLVIISVISLIISYFQHKNILPALAGIAGGGLIFYHYYFGFNLWYIYAGMLFLMGATVSNFIINKRKKTCCDCSTNNGSVCSLKSIITCPECKNSKEETIPTDSCQFFYECTFCKKVLKPKPGDCCVFCSYGTVKCPSHMGK